MSPLHRAVFASMSLMVTCAAAQPVHVDDFTDHSLTGWSHRDNAHIQVGETPDGNAYLALHCDFTAASYAWTYHTFDDVRDVSHCAGLTARIRGDGSPHALHPVLKSMPDARNQFVGEIGAPLRQTRWRRVFFPFSAFPKLAPADISETKVIGFVVFQSGDGDEAQVCIDDITLVPSEAVAPAPQLLVPDDGFASPEPPTLRWQPVPHAESYTIELAQSPEFAEATEIRAATTEATPDQLPQGTWHFRVTAQGSEYLFGEPSDARSFTYDTSPPRLSRIKARPDILRLIYDDQLTSAPTVRVDGRPPAEDAKVSGTHALVTLSPRLEAGKHELVAAGAVNLVNMQQQGEATMTFDVPEWLPMVEDRTEQITKRPVRPQDLDWFEREAAGAGNNLSRALRATAWIANSIDGVIGSETFGWQASHRYRSNPDRPAGHDKPANSRIMEAVYTPFLAYTLDRPFNPYYHDETLRRRLHAALDYWLDLQGENGGLPEYRGFGSEELPSTSFGMEFLVEIYAMLEDDSHFDEQLRQRLLKALGRAAEWAATPGPRSTEQGYHYSNQYCGALYGMWRLYELTGNEHWRELYHQRLDAWIENAQQSPFWYEADAPETFGYSRITEWELDRIFIRNDDERLLQSLRRYYEWCALNTVVERDEKTFIMDNVAHGRTSSNGPRDSVGYYNHIAAILPEARPWTSTYTMTDAEKQQRIDQWLNAPANEDQPFPDNPYVYNPFSRWMYFQPHCLWTITENQRLDALRNLPTLARERFTRYFHSEWGDDHYLFAKRPGVYATVHWGRPGHRQGKEIGLVWLPGFGTILRSYNNTRDFAMCTRIGENSTFKRDIIDPQIAADARPTKPNQIPDTASIALTAKYPGLGVTKTYTIDDRAFSVTVQAPPGAVEQIPVYIDRDDGLTLDGAPLDLEEVEASFTGTKLIIERHLGGGPARAAIEFDRPHHFRLRRAYGLARGAVWIIAVSLNDPARLTYHCHRVD